METFILFVMIGILGMTRVGNRIVIDFTDTEMIILGGFGCLFSFLVWVSQNENKVSFLYALKGIELIFHVIVFIFFSVKVSVVFFCFWYSMVLFYSIHLLCVHFLGRIPIWSTLLVFGLFLIQSFVLTAFDSVKPVWNCLLMGFVCFYGVINSFELRKISYYAQFPSMFPELLKQYHVNPTMKIYCRVIYNKKFIAEFGHDALKLDEDER